MMSEEQDKTFPGEAVIALILFLGFVLWLSTF
jgi:hypothetical protein